MCVICGNPEHQTFELLQKALTKAEKKEKELPRYKALAQLEAGFKKQFINRVADMAEEIISVIS